jgi:hypothetical protein
MDFLIIEYNLPDQPQLVRSHSVMDEDMPIYMILMENYEDAIKVITNRSSKIVDFPRLLDIHCLMMNAGKIISGEKKFSELEYEEKETDIGTVKLVTIQISPKIK